MSDIENDDRLDRLEKTVARLQNSIDYLVKQTEHNKPPLFSSTPPPQKKEADNKQESISLQSQPLTEQKQSKPATPIAKPIETEPKAKQTTLSAQEPKKTFTLPEHMRSSEYWLNKIGIGLILFSVIFAFKYSIDKGWITPLIRIAFGLALGSVLLSLGLRLYKLRRHFSLVLLGGGIATYYICGFATYQIFSLVSHPVAFGFMIAVTTVAYLLAIRQNEPVLSIIGTAGGLGTPFLLYSGSGNLPGLMLYLGLLLLCAILIYFFKGWRSLLSVAVAGNWIVFVIAYTKGVLPLSESSNLEQWAFQSGIIFSWLIIWLMPVAREILAIRKPDAWRYSPLLFGGKPVSKDVDVLVSHMVHILAVSTPIISLALSINTWHLTNSAWGWILLPVCAIYAIATYLLYRFKVIGSLIYTHGLLSLLFLTIALSLLLEGNTLFVTLAGEAFVLFLIGRKTNDIVIKVVSNILYGVLAMIFVAQFQFMQNSHLLSADSISKLFFISTTTAIFFLTDSAIQKRIYFIFSAFGLALWIYNFIGDYDWAFFALTIQCIAMMFYFIKVSDKTIRITTHVYWILLGLVLFSRYAIDIFDGTDATGLLSQSALVNQFAIASAFGLRLLLANLREYRFYLVGAFAMLGMLLVSEFEGNWRLVLITAEVFVFHYIAFRAKDKFITISCHVFSGTVAYFVLNRLLGAPDKSLIMLNGAALSDIFFIILLAISGAIYYKRDIERIPYLFCMHLFMLIFIYRELSYLSNGQGLVSAVWGVYSIAIIVAGLRKNDNYLRLSGLATLGLVIGKLFIIDLGKIEAIWKVLLFLGMGGIILIISYYFKALWKNAPDQDASSDNIEQLE